MGKEIRLFKSQERKTRDEVAAFLTQLADKISAGQVVLKKGQEGITLAINHFSIQHLYPSTAAGVGVLPVDHCAVRRLKKLIDGFPQQLPVFLIQVGNR